MKEKHWLKIVSNAPQTTSAVVKLNDDLCVFLDECTAVKREYRVMSQALRRVLEQSPALEEKCEYFSDHFGDQLSRFDDFSISDHLTLIFSLKKILWRLTDDLLCGHDELSKEGTVLFGQDSSFIPVTNVISGTDQEMLPPFEQVYQLAIKCLALRDSVKDVLTRLNILDRRLIEANGQCSE